MGRRFKISGPIPPGQEEAAKKIINLEALAYARYKKARLKEGLLTIPYTKHLPMNNTVTAPDIFIVDKPLKLSHQALKTIKPLRAIFDFEEPVCHNREYRPWSIVGQHKGRKHVSIKIEKGRFNMGINYLAHLHSKWPGEEEQVITLKDGSLGPLIETINTILNFRM